jgi:hypothetical protein
MPLPDFEALIRACCGGAGGENFAKFREEWHDYLEAAIAPFIQDWAEGDLIARKAYAEYLDVLSWPCSERIQYQIYFLAIAYAYLAQRRGNRSIHFLRQLMGKELADRYGDHDLCVRAFCAILLLPHPCFYELLDACFRRPPHVFGLPLPIQPKASKQCSDQFSQSLRL